MLTIEEFDKKRANRNTSLFGDSVDAFQAGAAESVSGMANFVGWDSAAKKLQEVANSQYETMTPESQSALAKRMINDDLSMGEGMLDGRTWLLQGAKLVGNLATTAVPGGAAGKAVSLAGMAAKGAKGLQAASTAARGTNLGTNISLNVASAGGMLGQQSEQAINELDFADLKDSPAFQNLVKEYHAEGGESDFDILNRARSTLAKQANETISRDPTMMVINGVFGTFGDQALGKVMTSGLGKTLKAQIGKAMVAEGATEAVQGGAEQYTQNTGINAQAETQLFEPTQGVAANALEGGIIGAVAGGAISAPGHAVHKVKQRSFEKQIEQKLPQQTIDQLRAAGYKDADIKSSLWEKTTNAALAHGFDADQADIMAKNYLSAMFDNGPTAEQRAQAEEAQEAQAPEQPQPQQPEQQAPAGRYENTAQGALHNDANNLIKGLQSRRKQALKDNDQELANQIGQDMSRLMGGRDRIVKDITDNEGNITEPKFDEQGRAAYMNALRRTAENYFPEQVQQPEQPPAQEQAPHQEQMFDPETGEVAEPVQQQEPIQQNPETVQQDQNALGESLRRGELGFVDETAQQDVRFREGLRRAMDVSPAAVLQVAEMRKSGQMNQNQAISALQRIINSQEVTGIDQRPTDTFEQSLQDESARQRNAQRVQYERGERGSYQPNVEESPEFQRRQAELLQGRQQQEFTKGQQGQTRPNGERDVSPLATGIENQFEANAPQVEFDRWSQVQEGDQGVDQREYNSPYASNPQTTEMEQGTIYQPRQQEREQVRYEDPAPTAQEVVNQSRGQRGGVLKGGLGEQQPKGNQRQQKKAAKKLNAKRQSIYERITQSDPLEANELEFSTGYQPNAAMLEAFDSLSVTQEQPTVQDISERLDQLESDGVIDAEDKQAILEQEQPEAEAEQELDPKVDESLISNNTEQPNSSTVSPELKESVEHKGVELDLPIVSKEMEADYNRGSHLGRGRDFNQEIIDSSKNILDTLDSKGLLDTPERKAKAKELIEKYQKSNVEFIKWETAHAVKHPSWHVTGRSNRNMSKYNDAQDRHMRQFSSKVDALTDQKKRITSSVESVMNDQQKAAKKEKGEETLKKRMESEVIGYLVRDIFNNMQEGKPETAKENRKWALRKAKKSLETLIYNDKERGLKLINDIDSKAKKESKNKWGIMAIVGGKRSALGKYIDELINIPTSKEAMATDIQVKKLNEIANDFFRGLDNVNKTVARKAKDGREITEEEASKAISQHDAFVNERESRNKEADEKEIDRSESLYGHLTKAELMAELERLSDSGYVSGEVSDGKRSTKKATTNEAARGKSEEAMKLERYIKHKFGDELTKDPLSLVDEKISNLKDENEQLIKVMKDTAGQIPSAVGKHTSESERAEKIYREAFDKSRSLRKEIRSLENERAALKPKPKDEKTEYAKELERRRAEKEASVTSSTYERARKRLDKEVEGFLSGPGVVDSTGVEGISKAKGNDVPPVLDRPAVKDNSNPTESELQALIDWKQSTIDNYEARISNGESPKGMDGVIAKNKSDIATLTKRLKKAGGDTGPKISEIANVLKTVNDPLLRDYELFSLYPDDMRKDFADSIQAIIDDLEPIVQNWKEKDPIRGKSDRALYSERNKSVFARLAKTEIDKPLQDYVWLVNKHDTTANKEVFTPLQLLSTGRLDSKMGVGTGKAAHHEALNKLLHNLRQVWDAVRVRESKEETKPTTSLGAEGRVALHKLQDAIKLVKESTRKLDDAKSGGKRTDILEQNLSRQKSNLQRIYDDFISSYGKDFAPNVDGVLNNTDPEPTPPKGTKKGGYTRTNTAPRGSEAAKPKDLKGYTKAILVQEDRPTTKEATLGVAKGLRDDHDAIIAELNSMTMPNIKKMMGTYWAMTHNDYKKGQLVKAAYDGMMKQMLFTISDGAFVTTSGQSGVELGDYVIKQIEAVSNEKFNEIQEKKAEQRKAEEAEAARRKEALGDPKTLQDFVAYARNKGNGIESFTPEQLKRYDELVSENKLAQLEQQRKAAAEVKAVNGDVPYQLAETIHTKLQEPRYVVQLTGERMGKDAFKELATRARQLGGNYVNAMQAKRYNTIDGFQFANVDDRNNFSKLLDGESVSREANQQRQLEKKQDSRVTKLKEMADATEARADEVLNQSRKTNTAKRAADAARVMDNAYADQYSARLLRAIAEATESGDIQVLSNLSQKVQLDELDTIERQVLWNMPEAQREKFGQRDDRGNWRLKATTKLDDILFWAKYPVPEARADRLNRLADDMENVSGYKQAAKKIRSNTKKAQDNSLIQMTGRDWESAVAKIRDFARKNKNEYIAENIAEMFKREDRLNRMGIDGPAMLRYVLREKAMIEQRISTDKPVETPVTKLTKKVEETIRDNRNAYNDFFPTDNDTLADQVIDEADIQPGMKVLEPSAGMGHLADKIKGTGADLDVGEFAYTMSELLKAKGHNVVSGDFLEYNPGEIYDRIVMNPPFSNDSDVKHVTHALNMLKPGGRLVAITSSMAGDRSNSTNKNFREYLDAVGAVERPNPDNSFKDSLNPTGVNTKTIIIDKPDVDENLPNFDDIRFSQNAVVTKPVKGMKAVEVETAAQKWKDSYAGLKAANVQVVQSQSELKDWVQTDPEATVKAVWLSQDNRVILVADNLASPQDVRQAMRHELIGHNGVFGNLDAEQSQLLTDQVMGLRKNKKLASIFAEVDASYKKVPDYVKAEEVVSRLAEQETGKLRQVADRVMAFVMGAMRRSGFLAADKVTLSEVRNMINGVDKYLRKNDGTLSQSDVVRFSQRVDQVQGMDQEYMAALEGSQQSLLQKILKAPKSALGKSNIVDSVKNGGLGLLTLRQLVDVAESKLGSDFHTNMKTYLDEVNQMMADEGNGHQNIMNVFEPLDKWRRKNPELADRTFEAMHEFTLDNVDPFQDYQDLTPELKKAKAVLQEKMKGRSGESKAQWMKEVNEIDAQIKYEPKRKKNLERSKSTLNSLPKEAQKVIKEIRDHYNQQREDMYDAMMERAADLAMNGGLNKGQMLKIRLDNEIAKKSFYVPLTRFGDYFIDGVDENGERVFTMYQTENEMLEAKDHLKASGFEVKSGKSIDSFAGLDTISTTVVKKMFDHLETTTMSQKARDAMKDNVYQMYLESLPNRSIRKQFIHRKGVKGFSKDALQALADQGAKQAKQLAKFKHEDALAKSMANLNDAYNQLKMLPEEEGENRVFTARFMDEMTKRNEWVMNPKRAAWASKLTGFGFLWMIGASPASAMINLTQNIQVAIPVIGSKHGVAATSKVMAGLTGDFFKHFKGAHADMKKRRQFGILGSTILSGDEQNAMKHAIAMGVIDTTQAHDLLDMAENQPTKLTDRKAKIMRGIGWMFHHAEVLNREVTYMTAYRLARQSGDSHQNAMEYATKATWDSHFDYGSLNRARFMQGDVAAVALQFKQYSQNMTYYLFSNFSKAWLNKKIPMDERREARKQLLGTMAATFLFGGLGALPVATIAGIANTAYAVFGDDDDPWDAEVEMREILKEWFGRELAHGIYYGMGTMVGAPNISGRIEIDPLSMWVRPSDAIGARAQFGDYTKQMLGPMYSTIYNAFSGADYIFRDQKYQKGFEMMMPKWVRDVSKTARYLGEGGNIQNNNGDIVVDDLSPLEYVEQVLGFTPNRSVVQYAENRAIKSYERHAMDRRKLLLNGMWLAYRNKDGDSVKKLWKKINEYNKSEWGRARPITQKTVSQSLKSRIRTQANARKGLHFNSKYSDLIDAKFAQN
ncbi:PLxRFG domain-containing protein [Vibrio toranzoniae]|uniref:PLxRFG domain-containing protein n=1 Tax=Vibrio toranzoniae TaxID=1194427 RepID=UPI0013765685|nr:PLxRFG domain-containing protein [Vibrio toranzoniae]NAZ55428.1 PLxRFG domain-containing protein [Vibrio toranzoniae]